MGWLKSGISHLPRATGPPRPLTRKLSASTLLCSQPMYVILLLPSLLLGRFRKTWGEKKEKDKKGKKIESQKKRAIRHTNLSSNSTCLHFHSSLLIPLHRSLDAQGRIGRRGGRRKGEDKWGKLFFARILSYSHRAGTRSQCIEFIQRIRRKSESS